MLKNLRDVREKLLGYRLEFIGRTTQIGAERLRAIEAGGAEPTVFELERLARLYGVDAERLATEPIELAPGDGVQTLTSLPEFVDLDDVTRAKIIAAANAARDLVTLRGIANEPDPRNAFARNAPRLEKPRNAATPHRQGAAYAVALRKTLGLQKRPIESMRDLMRVDFSEIAVLYANLGSSGLAGLSFADPLRGPAIVLNLEGKNRNPCVRRFSLAHELCHLLVDWDKHQSLTTISGYFTESALEQEQRANAFAVRFLCPPTVIQQCKELSKLSNQRKLAAYGLPYSAIRLYLHNEADVELPKTPSSEFAELGTSNTRNQWVDAEEPEGIDHFPLNRVPPERRTLVARTASRLYSLGALQRDEYAEFLGVTPSSEVEQVLDFFDLDLPGYDTLAV